jgi:hypothetical protein
MSNNETNIKTIQCTCGIICPKSNAFSVYDKFFCSIKCLKPYKEEEDQKRIPKQTTNSSIRSYDYGGAAC